jgi:hypothetical protein
MKTNVRIYCIGELSEISKTEKKNLKKEVKEYIMDIFKHMKSIETLIKIPLPHQGRNNGQCAIYSEEKISKREEVDLLFPKKITKTNTNYLLGKVEINKKNLLYLIDVDQLYDKGEKHYREYCIWPSSHAHKTMHVRIN